MALSFCTVLASLLAIALAIGNDDNAGAPKDEQKTRSAQATTQAINARLERVENAMEAQQEQIEQLRQQLQVRDSTIQRLQQQVDQDQTVVTEADQKSDAAASNGDAAVSWVCNPLSDFRT